MAIGLDGLHAGGGGLTGTHRVEGLFSITICVLACVTCGPEGLVSTLVAVFSHSFAQVR